MADEKTIEVKCHTQDTLAWREIEPFQGELKARSREQIAKLAHSIIKHGWAFPEFVWVNEGHKWCLDGHGRLAAAAELENAGYVMPPIPVVYVDAADETEAKELLLKLNSRYGVITQEGFELFVKDIDIDLNEYELPNIKEPEIDLDKLDQVDGDGGGSGLKIKAADLFLIGPHRLICADARDEEAYKRLMDGKLADMVFTDPPYGVSIGGKNKRLSKIGKRQSNRITAELLGDLLDDKAFTEVLIGVFMKVYNWMADDASFYVCYATDRAWGRHIYAVMAESGLSGRQQIIWAKNRPTFSINRDLYSYQHEGILYGWKKTHKFYGLGKYQGTLWHYDRPDKNALHPTMKPPELIMNAIENSMTPVEKPYTAALNSTVRNDIILDPFAGSGSTLIAAQECKRRARLIELDLHYCDVIVSRVAETYPDMECTVIHKDGTKEKVL